MDPELFVILELSESFLVIKFTKSYNIFMEECMNEYGKMQ